MVLKKRQNSKKKAQNGKSPTCPSMRRAQKVSLDKKKNSPRKLGKRKGKTPKKPPYNNVKDNNVMVMNVSLEDKFLDEEAMYIHKDDQDAQNNNTTLAQALRHNEYEKDYQSTDERKLTNKEDRLYRA